MKITYLHHSGFSVETETKVLLFNKGAPLRTKAGGRWLNGYSDHLPVVMYLVKEKK